MQIFGHAGITLGAAVLLSGALQRSHFSKTEGDSSQTAPNHDDRESWFAFLGSCIDIRLLLVGSLLPDIIDKPIGQFFFRETFSHGRIFSHTLIFLILVALAGLYLYRCHDKIWLLVLSFGIFTHLMLDRMWRSPRTLFWPLFGFTFERIDLTYWVQDMLYALLAEPGVYIPELVGAAILLWFGVVLARRRKIGVFIRYGQLK
ncbi:metal-dependent hydrolase [Chloroflexota bacterium]